MILRVSYPKAAIANLFRASIIPSEMMHIERLKVHVVPHVSEDAFPLATAFGIGSLFGS
jgi:hypothetical protein